MSSIFPLMVLLLLVANAVTVVNSIPNREFDSMLNTLRSRGYHLFCNAILTSDLRIDLLDPNSNATNSFTFFAPTDSSLFALDMTQTASSYTDTLRYHIIPRRLTLSELRLLPNGYTLPTMLSTRRISFTRRSGSSSVTTVGGVEVAFPGLFYGRHVTVHGLAGILNVRSVDFTSPAPAPVNPIHSPDHRHFTPRRIPHSPEKQNQTVLDPVPRSVSFNVTGRQGGGSSHAVEAPVKPPAPEPAQSPEIGRIHVHSSVNFGTAPSAAPVLSPQHSDSGISFPPEGYSEAEAPAPAPVGLEAVVQKKKKNRRVSLMEMSEKSEALDGVRKCESVAVGLKEHISDIDGVGHMQCYAA
ncbi:putative FAS1 domain-containing protein [Medicago truncatula]|uniref:Fasciclin domain protein n=1 Tax=Medicago truncatula TaxID=3880 RepID=G7IL68_MEDTR|nr:uncharacterized protein LOC11430342 [Medicago truncatula]AES63356.1 fasciclin domain protein [Medicago truncatula]RHN71588.1 putative FAS1 domain-containing protein [Medicago truncatula]